MRILLAAALLLPTLAFADPTVDASKMKTDDCARARKQNKTCVIDMGKGDDVEGSTPTAGGSALSFRDWVKLESLIRIRKDFVVEILKTAEDL